MDTALTIVDQKPVGLDVLRTQVNNIQKAMQEIMIKGTHYGVVPGCGDKPTLLKPGAEKICLMFRLLPQFKVDTKEYPNGHREYSITCALYSPDGNLIAEGVGSCSTLESKYRYRQAQRTCPKCGKATIMISKFGTGGFYCNGKAGGCGEKFALGDESITKQQLGRIENPDIADQYNTVLKMAKKRAHVDATITATAAGDIFTQDIEDLPPESLPIVEPPKSTQKSTKAANPTTSTNQVQNDSQASNLDDLKASVGISADAIPSSYDYESDLEF